MMLWFFVFLIFSFIHSSHLTAPLIIYYFFLPHLTGFHEDGFTSGIHLAHKYFNAKLPFDIRSPDRTPVMSRQERVAEWVMGMLEVVRRVVGMGGVTGFVGLSVLFWSLLVRA